MRFCPISRMLAAGLAALLLSACAETELVIHAAKRIGAAPRADAPTVGRYKIGQPYKVEGVWYYPKVDFAYDVTGIASWYGKEFHGRPTANGERYNMNALTAAHKTLPMPSLVQVINLENGRSIRVRVNDRGPFVHGRIIDVSRRSAQLLGFYGKGTAKVRVKVLAKESMALAPPGTVRPASAAPNIPLVDKAPRIAVTREALPPPRAAPPRPANEAPKALEPPRMASARAAASEPHEGLPIPPPKPLPEVVSVQRVGKVRMFIQAGAFTEYVNANRLKARLASLGPAQVNAARVDGNDYYRVRVGPLASVGDADAMLARIIETGHHGARIVID